MDRTVLQRVEIAQDALRQAVALLDPDEMPPHEAGRLLEAFDGVVRTAATGSTLLEALRAKAEADRSAAERHQRLHRERRVRRYTDGEVAAAPAAAAAHG